MLDNVFELSFFGYFCVYPTSKIFFLMSENVVSSLFRITLAIQFSRYPLLFCFSSKQISEEKLFFIFLLKSFLNDGPKWTRTTDLTLIRRAL